MWNIIAVILVLAIVAIGLLEVYQSYESGTTAQSGQDLISETSSTIANLQTVYGQSPNFTSFIDATPYNVGALPSDWSGTGPYSLADGGVVTFTAVTQVVNKSTPANPNGYSMSYAGLSDGQCAALSNYNVPQMFSVTVNGKTTSTNPAFTNGAATTGATAWPPALAASCLKAGNNTVTYTIIG